MYHLLENIFISKELYIEALEPVCEKYGLNHTELVILLFLAESHHANTATDIVERRRITKSSVSLAVRTLQESGYISGEFIAGNHRSIHLKLCEKAKPIIEEGLNAQSSFIAALTRDLSEAEKEQLKICFGKVAENLNNLKKGE